MTWTPAYAISLCAVVSAVFGVLYHLMRSRLVVYALPTVALSVSLLLYPPAHPVVVAMACCLVGPFMMARGLNVSRRCSGMRAVLITEEIARALADERFANRDSIAPDAKNGGGAGQGSGTAGATDAKHGAP